MKYFLLTLNLLCSCGHHASQDTKLNFTDLQHQRDQIVATYNTETITKCDYATFALLYNAFGGKADLTGLEDPSGKWNRNAQPCYPTESNSETSLDTYLMALQYAASTHDMGLVDRIVAYAEPQDWVTGAGPVGITSILPLVPVLGGMQLAVSSFRSDLLAVYILLTGRLNGDISTMDVDTLKLLNKETPGNPLYLAILHRFTDGDQTDTVDYLQTMSHTVGATGWGSCPYEVLFTVVVGIMEGR